MFFYFHPKTLGEEQPILTDIFQLGWNLKPRTRSNSYIFRWKTDWWQDGFGEVVVFLSSFGAEKRRLASDVSCLFFKSNKQTSFVCFSIKQLKQKFTWHHQSLDGMMLIWWSSVSSPSSRESKQCHESTSSLSHTLCSIDMRLCEQYNLLFVSLPSLKLTYPLKIDPWKRRFLLETTIFRCYVSFRGCNVYTAKNWYSTWNMTLLEEEIPILENHYCTQTLNVWQCFPYIYHQKVIQILGKYTMHGLFWVILRFQPLIVAGD